MTQDLIARIIATKTQASEYALAYDKLDDAAARNAWAGVANLLSDITDSEGNADRIPVGLYDIGDSPTDTDEERDRKIIAWLTKNSWCKMTMDEARVLLGYHWTKDQRNRIQSDASDLALIDMHVPGLMPLESGSSDFGFVNKFDASGRSLSGGDIA